MRWQTPVIVVLVLLLLLLLTVPGQQLLHTLHGGVNNQHAADVEDADDDDDDAPSRLQIKDDILGIELSASTQALSGIRVEPVAAMEHQAEIRALAEVVGMQPLLELRARYNGLRAKMRITEVQQRRSREAYERLRLLHEDNANISTRQLEEARAQMQADNAQLAAQQQQLDSLREEAGQAWGETLAKWALNENDNALFQQLLQRQDVLLNVTLGRDQSLPDHTRTVYINQDNNRLNARKAYLVAAAPGTSPSLQGETYYFRTPADKLRVGMRVHVWVPTTGETVSGVHLPSQSVVWQADEAWVYLRLDDDFFYRRALDEPVKLGDGWFVPADQIKAGSDIVTRGVQMLLSEEYRWQIPDEDDDV